MERKQSMKKVEIISLFGIDSDYEERTPPNLDLVSIKQINLKFDKLSCTNEFKHIYENSRDYLENVLANRKYKQGFKKSKELFIENVYAEQKMRLEQSAKNDKKSALKTRR